MATLALGLAGAAVGSFVGGPLGAQVGWMLGAALGNALDPQKTEGPRLQDLKLHNSTYGLMTPFLWGTMRIAGNIIDEQPELTEHSDTSGGKGGPEVTNYSYTCSFAVRMCEGPILGLRRIWANGRLIYDHTGDSVISDDLPLTIYLGDEEQLPDPTLETIHGANNVPAYRGIAYVVFTDLLLTEFGNTLPNLNFEVFTNRAGDIPRQVSLVSGGTGNRHGATLDADGIVTQGDYSGANYIEKVYDLFSGALLGTTTTACDPISDTPTGTFPLPTAISNPTEGAQAACLGHGGIGVQQAWYYKTTNTFQPFCGPVHTGSGFFGLRFDNGGARVGSHLYSIGNASDPFVLELCKWNIDTATGMVTGFVTSTAAIQQQSAGTYRVATSTDGLIYVKYGGVTIPSSGHVLDQFDADLNLVRFWTGADVPSIWSIVGESFVIYDGMLAVTYANVFTSQTIILWDIDTLSPTSEAIGSLVIGGSVAQGISHMSGGYCIVENGFVTLNRDPGPVLLSEIVADLSERAGLDESQFDVEELTDLVDGYLVTEQTTAREMIEPLRNAYFFDAVERDGAVVFVKRGHDAVVAIDDDELAAHGDGEQAPPILGTVRGQEVDLPRVVNVDYVNAASDYQTGTQQARRQVTLSQAEISLNLNISMDDVKAKSVADTQLYTAWVERNRFSFFTSRKYALYEPTDVVTVGARSVRVLEKNETRPGVVKWDCVEALAAALIHGGGAVPPLDFTSSPPGGVVVTGPTTAYLLDLPLIAEADDPDGFYAAMSWSSGAGAGLYESSDGITYASIATTTSRASMGTTTNTLGNFTGGNWPDEVNWVDVVMLYGELASTTEDGLLNGANLASVGDEVLQFERAELVDVATYRLTGLLRGRLGTEFAMSSHTSDEDFALLPTTLRVHQDYAELYTSRSFKAVTFNKPLASADAQSFTNTGAARRPYSPVLLGGGTDGSGNVELHWTRRTRLGGGAWLSVDVPLSEPEEVYSVLIWNSTYTLCAREIVVLAATTTTYTAANQVTDFGATQQTIFFSVRQVGTAALGTEARGSAPGAGASNVDPLAPITPP